jgi:hypothetical protein
MRPLALSLLLLTGCEGAIEDPARAPPLNPVTTGPQAAGPKAIAQSGLRRLTSSEYDLTLNDLLQDPAASSALRLPATQYDPFDNDFTTQYPSQSLIEGAEALASDASQRLLADPARRDAIVGCTPSGPDDAQCFTQFITSFGRRALRRSLTPDEVTAYRAFQDEAVMAGDFYVAVDMVIRAMLQDPRFLYRVEIGAPVASDPTLLALDGPELASRLSYFLWGSMPADWLLDLAEGGQLATPEQLRSAAQTALMDPRASDRIGRFHALWLGYDTLPFDASLSLAMRTESDELINRVIFSEHRPWQDLFRFTETFVNDTLATHYGLTPPGSASGTWVSYGTTGRQGILSQGAFLSNGAKFGDTSPTQRGLAVRRRLLCQEIPPPPPGVNVDAPVPATGTAVCKVDRYKAHSAGGCASCHGQMDPIGFGLENYDQEGRYRATDNGDASCTITGDGTLLGVGDFNGPKGLEDLLLTSSQFSQCAVTQVFRFAFGHKTLDTDDTRVVQQLSTQVGTGDFRFDALVLDLVASDAFMNVRSAQGGPDGGP